MATALLAVTGAALPAVPAAADIWDGEDGHWRYVASYKNRFLCKGAGTALVFSGGADDYSCVGRRGRLLLFIR
ncbi:hypothetical protein [Bailinhaonella thermotolerans]|uniref:Uncharacterized protein n=1 Tax=Bailinhaonella thermotolerans TaxID=1070861 RepID=A0A3A4AWR9_9ACTN|nr:hypothetical protein [Bailinhaonella thermotolerans]RJL32737.1 hypothetical protein D5H75_14755 [Bailinhaonella thermotolerans]